MKGLDFQEVRRIRKLLEKIYLLNEQHFPLLSEYLEQISSSMENGNPAETDDPTKQTLLDALDLMQLMKISRSTYYRLKNAKMIRPIKVGSKDYFTPAEIKRILNRK